MKPKDLSINDIKIGDSATFSRIFTEDDVNNFAELSGDFNPLHMEEKYAETTKFKHRIVHGMLVGSLCSTLVGMYLPGKRCLYLSQTLSFKKPVYINDKLFVSGNVLNVSISTNVLEIGISIKNSKEEVLNGIAKVQVI